MSMVCVSVRTNVQSRWSTESASSALLIDHVFASVLYMYVCSVRLHVSRTIDKDVCMPVVHRKERMRTSKL